LTISRRGRGLRVGGWRTRLYVALRQLFANEPVGLTGCPCRVREGLGLGRAVGADASVTDRQLGTTHRDFPEFARLAVDEFEAAHPESPTASPKLASYESLPRMS